MYRGQERQAFACIIHPGYDVSMHLSIVSFLDQTATQSVRELQQALSVVTGSKASLTAWQPHITLGDGVDVSDAELDDFKHELQQVSQSAHAFELILSGFSSLDARPIGAGEVSTPYVIFIDVVLTADLCSIVAMIDDVIRDRLVWYRMPRPYLPHVTLAFRDLSEAGYQKGLAYLRNKHVQLTAVIDHIALVQKLPHVDTEIARIPLR